jgi:hypothetical protein
MSENKFDYLNVNSSDTPRLTVKFDSKKDINNFLHRLIEINGESNTCIFFVGHFFCLMELAVKSNNVTFWIAEDESPQLRDLTKDSKFDNFEWMKYYQTEEKVFEIPLSELYKIIQHLLRINKLKYFL